MSSRQKDQSKRKHDHLSSCTYRLEFCGGGCRHWSEEIEKDSTDILNILNRYWIYRMLIVGYFLSQSPSPFFFFFNFISSLTHKQVVLTLSDPVLSCRGSIELWGSKLSFSSLCDINQSSLLTPFYSVLVSVCVFIALSTVFHSIRSPNNSPLSHSVLPVLFLPYWSFQLCVSLWKSPSALMKSFVVDWA